jgi:CDP-diacylglycerol--glycerol-3-phosphate 3-phosphatidyltransferase
MSNRPKSPFDRSKAFNLPNQLTSLRLVLAVIMFALIAWDHFVTSFVLFVVAASTDWLDGYYARKYGQVTTLGRILDPFADKVIICGTFIFLVAVPETLAAKYGLRPWMVVVIVGRELLVTALRSFIEDRGSDFSAKWSGKWKMLLQCIAAGAGLVYLACAQRAGTAEPPAPDWVWGILVASTWAAVLLTIYSGIGYVAAAVKLLRE